MKLQFPTMLRKMWSGGEVQQWIDEQLARQWVSTDDYLPKTTGRVLFVTEYTEPEIAVYIKYKGLEGGKFKLEGNDITDKVTYWMPLLTSPHIKDNNND